MDEPNQIRRAMQGDSDAWAELVTVYQEAVFRLAYLIVRDAADAEDIVQETLIRAYAGLRRFDSERPLRPWLLTITVNLARNHQRGWRRYMQTVQRWWRQQSPTESPENVVSVRTEAEALAKAVARLPSVDREVLYLRFFLELSEEESADVLKVARGTVKSRQSRALERLRKVVAAEFPALQEGRAHERTA